MSDSISVDLFSKSSKDSENESIALTINKQAGSRGLLSDEESGSFTKSLYNDIMAPIANHLIVEPYGAVRSVVNFPLQTIASADLLPRIEPLEQRAETLLSPSWALQSACTGASMAVVLTGMQRLMSGCFRYAGIAGIGAGGALVAGGSLYEYLREPRENESRMSNMLSGMAMLSILEGGNSFCSQLNASRMFATRFAVGAASTVPHMLSTSWLTGKSDFHPSFSNMFAAGAMNMALGKFANKPVESIKPTYSTELINDASVKPLTFENTRSALTISEPISERLSIVYGIENGKIYRDFTDYLKNGQGYGCPQMKTYKVNELDAMRLSFPDRSPNYPRISPEALLDQLRSVPDVRLFKRVVVSDWAHKLEPWYKQVTLDSSSRILGETGVDGTLYFHRPTPGLQLPNTVIHEWSHLFFENSPQFKERFLKALREEPLQVSSRSRIEHSSLSAEAWPILSEDLLSPNAPTAKLTAVLNPKKAAIWDEALSQRLLSIPRKLQGPNHQYYLDRSSDIRAQIATAGSLR